MTRGRVERSRPLHSGGILGTVPGQNESAGNRSSKGRQPEEGGVINRIYIDNYKCFVNFEYHPGSLQLLMGSNGTGKTAVLDILEILREFVAAGTVATTASAFHPS